MLDVKQLFRCMCLMTGMFPRLLLKKNIDAIFVWGRAADEWKVTRFDDGVLKLAADLNRSTGASVVIPGYTGAALGQSLQGYPGPSVWRITLRKLGVASEDIVSVSGKGHNTKTEMEDLLTLATTAKWTTIVGVTLAHYALRAMLGTVKSLQTYALSEQLTIVPVWSHTLDWNRECHGSQGTGPYPRLQWIDEEFDRISRYQAQGDLASLEELYHYLRWIYQQQ